MAVNFFKSLRNIFRRSDISQEIDDLQESMLLLCEGLSVGLRDTQVDTNNERKELIAIYIRLVYLWLAMEYVGYLTLNDKAAVLDEKFVGQPTYRFKKHLEKQFSDFVAVGHAELKTLFVENNMLQTLASLCEGSLRFFPLDRSYSDKDAIVVRAARMIATECEHDGSTLVERRVVMSLMESLAPIKHHISLIAAKMGTPI